MYNVDHKCKSIKLTDEMNRIQSLNLKKMKNALLGLSLTLLLFSCKTKEKTLIEDPAKLEESIEIVLQERVFSKEEQQALTPEIVLSSLMEGNERFRPTL